jgi:hypothetical protein
MGLTEAREELIDGLEDALSIIAGGWPLPDLGETVEQISLLFQGIGCANLLLYGIPSGFDGTRLAAYGGGSRPQPRRGTGGHPISRTEAVFDAVVAAAPRLAREIVDLSPTDWMPDGEYEDDFCYYAFLHGVLADPTLARPAQLVALADRFEGVLAGEPSPRLALCRALLAHDPDRFADAFEALLAQRERDVGASRLSDDPSAEPRRHVFIEGLALLRLAADAGLPTAPGHRTCPDLARSLVAGPLPDDLWAEMDRLCPR